MEYVIVDLETTGLDTNTASIIEVGALLIRDDKIVGEYQSFVQFSKILSDEITRLTGIRTDMLKDAPPDYQVIAELKAFVAGRSVVAHNGFRFDYPLLARYGLEFDETYDSLEFAYFVLPAHGQGRSVSALARKYSLGTEKHRALDDCQLSYQVIEALRRDFSNRPVEHCKYLRFLAQRINWWWSQFIQGKSEALNSATDLIEPYEPYRKPQVDQGVLLLSNKIDEADVLACFDPALMKDGADYVEDRLEQKKMTSLVTGALNEKKVAIIEAGTGTGKTKAYLVPSALFALKNGIPVIIATFTKLLQNQIFDKEIPHIEKIIGRELRTALVKGAQNYVCLDKFDEFSESVGQLSLDRSLYERTQEGIKFTTALAHLLVASWLIQTEWGDWDEVPRWLKALFPQRVQDEIVNLEEMCNQQICNNHAERKCFLSKARLRAKDADIVIANHAVVFTGLQASEDIDQPLAHPVFAGESKYLILDEAHHLEDVATSAWGVSITRSVIVRQQQFLFGKHGVESILRREVGGATTGQLKSYLDALIKKKDTYGLIAKALIGTLDGLCSKAQDSDYTTCVSLDDHAKKSDIETLFKLLGDFFEYLGSLARDVKNISECDDLSEVSRLKIRRFSNHVAKFSDAVERFMNDDENYVRYLEMEGREAAMKASPISVATLLRDGIYNNFYSVVVASATLTVNNSFSFVAQRFGFGLLLKERTVFAALGSSFDYERQVQFFVPMGLRYDSKKSDEHFRSAAAFLSEAIPASRGGSLLLCTSHKDVGRYCDVLSKKMAERNILLLCQERSGVPDDLVLQFKEDLDSVLIGTKKLWEGVDVPGPSLRSLFITKIPYDVPNKPLINARIESIKREGGDWFRDYYEPLAVLALKQGFGRLIRKTTDVGIAVLLDERLADKAAIKNSLPKGVRVQKAEPAVIIKALQQLAENTHGKSVVENES